MSQPIRYPLFSSHLIIASAAHCQANLYKRESDATGSMHRKRVGINFFFFFFLASSCPFFILVEQLIALVQASAWQF